MAPLQVLPMHRHIKPGEAYNWIAFLAWRVRQRSAKVLCHFGLHRQSHITDALRRWLHKLSRSVANSRDRQPGALPTTELGITDGPRHLGGAGQQILTSAKSGAHRPLWRNIFSDLGSEFWAEFRKEIGKNVVRPFSVCTVKHREQFQGRVRRLFQLLFGNGRITAAKISGS